MLAYAGKISISGRTSGAILLSTKLLLPTEVTCDTCMQTRFNTQDRRSLVFAVASTVSKAS